MDITPIVPASAQELVAAVAEAGAAGTVLEVVGGGSKRGIGFPERATRVLSTARFDGVVDYDPPELVVTARAGTPLATVERLLAEHGQMLAFEPLLLGATASASTLGGVIAAGLAGPRRVSAGNVRDHVLGFSAVSGRGERFIAGGRVVKNVTGFDLPKLLCGSWGQLAVLMEVTLKVMPLPRCTLTLARAGLDDARALQAMRAALGSQAAVAAAAHLPARPDGWPATQPWPGANGDGPVTVFRLEGFGPSVEARAATLADTLGTALERWPESGALALWAQLRQAAVLEGRGEPLWRIVTGADPLAVCVGLRALGARYWIDWAGGVVHARIAAGVDGATVRDLALRGGGHALLLDAPVEYRRRTPARHPEQGAVATLARQVRLAFDPARILDPRRFEATPP